VDGFFFSEFGLLVSSVGFWQLEVGFTLLSVFFGAFCWSSVRFPGQKEQLTCMNGPCFVERWDDA